MVLTDLGGEALRQFCLLEKTLVLDGQIWRLALAHLVNLSRVHTYLNIAGLGLILVTLSSVLTARQFIWSVLASGGAISLGWLLLMPAGITYVGFSGITHGVMAFGALQMMRLGPRWFGWLILAVLLAKLGQEAINGAVPGAAAAIGGRVSFVAHALGALGGALAATGTAKMLRGALIALGCWLALVHAAREAAFEPAAQLSARPTAPETIPATAD
ncbi:rhombosortase [Ferrimonas balearica]|nr:rhombosortase [Ferrimonas balearica]